MGLNEIIRFLSIKLVKIGLLIWGMLTNFDFTTKRKKKTMSLKRGFIEI